MSNTLAGAYLAQGTIGNVGMPGAPITHFSLVVVPSQNTVSGTVAVTQAIAGNAGNFTVQVTGKIHATGLGSVTQIVSMSGQYVHSVPPPAIGSFLANFDAHMAIDGSWNGVGGFSYFNNSVENVPVKSN
jgi:hypothetical protein